MTKFLILTLLVVVLGMPVSAQQLTAPQVPDSVEELMPSEAQNLQEGIRYILRQTLFHVRPDLKEAYRICCRLILIVMIASICGAFPGLSRKNGILLGTVSISVTILATAGALINLAAEVITEVSHYGKLLLPVMTAALAAQGGVTASAAIYAGTIAFHSLLSGLISGVLIPAVYIYLALATVYSVTGLEILKKIRDVIKSTVVWILKTGLYVYTAYMGITGVVSGSTDAAALKATKLTISSVVPVVGGILSDASEAVLVSAGTIKNAAGIYGMLALMAILAEPFVKIGIHYLLFRLSGMICSVFGQKELSELIQDFGTGLGILLAMTGVVCLLFLFSIFCFMRGVG